MLTLRIGEGLHVTATARLSVPGHVAGWKLQALAPQVLVQIGTDDRYSTEQRLYV
jgi:hypothetical protein